HLGGQVKLRDLDSSSPRGRRTTKGQRLVVPPPRPKAVSLERTCTAQDSERDVARAARLDPESLLSQADIGLWGLFLVYNPDLIGNTPVFTARQTPSSGAFATRSSLSSSWSPATLEVLLRAGLAG